MRQLNTLPQPLAKPRAVFFDWAGTTIDYGSCAPAGVFREIFRQSGVEITAAEAREPMGRGKKDHIATIAAMPRVANAWKSVHGRLPTESDVTAMYDNFLPMQKAALAGASTMIPGVVEAVEWCRKRGMKIGASTGYTRELMDVVEPLAASQGYVPDVSICSDEVAAGRPAPWLNFRIAEKLGIYPLGCAVVVDDTPIGISAGLSAGCITVAVTQSGNQLGLTLAEVEALKPEELEAKIREIEDEFLRAGAHFAIRSTAELPKVLEQLL